MTTAAKKTDRTEAHLPHEFKRVRLELAREKAHPEGCATYGYILVLPLDKNDRIDTESWRRNRSACRVVRFRPGEPDAVGHIVKKPGGSWAFHYDIKGGDDDDAGYRLSDDIFVIGGYVSVRDDDGLHTFRIVSVQST